MTRVIRYFNKKDEALAGEVTVDVFSIDELRRYFNVEDENPMYDIFPIMENTDYEFIKKAGMNFDFETYHYFLEYN